ncbi:sterol carrier family protein [Pseudokineococcus sp. 1T1Z-3]|uniref:sterol carrier family protein n=1 Tax=Pseudokineococcus sp. 1T1Z-3 TaxID=3132745 RepID=UPI0030B546D3
MPARRRIPAARAREAVRAWASDPAAADRSATALAVRGALEELAARVPGSSVEVRVPPFGVAQCVEGPRHTRGTPPNVVETDAATWLALVTGSLGWDDALARGLVSASGQRAALGEHLPLFPSAPS